MVFESRREFKPPLPSSLESLSRPLLPNDDPTTSRSDTEQIQALFPRTYGLPILSFEEGKGQAVPRKLKVGVLFSGGQAPGGHNVIAGLFDSIREMDSGGALIGFLGGPDGLMGGRSVVLESDDIDRVRHTGGFDLIGSGRTKIESDEQLAAAMKSVRDLRLDGLVIIGGDDSNTNAAVIAEYFLENGCKTSVVGVPKTIDGDLKNEHIDLSFGFDTATKCYSQMISNIERDAISARKYYHFIKLMGRSASHIALECALSTHPNYTLIGEEIASKGWSLDDIITDIADMVVKRSEMDHDFGVILIPEGLIEFIPEMGRLIGEINQLIASGRDPVASLSPRGKRVFDSIPPSIQEELLLDRDSHGNVQVSRISVQRLLIEGVSTKLKEIEGYGGKFTPVEHFFGYEGRAAYPSNFDATYCYALGRVSSMLVLGGFSGYMSTLKGLAKPPADWEPHGTPIVSMMHMEERHGKMKPVIAKALVDLDGAPYKELVRYREEWKYERCYQYVPPLQFFGSDDVTYQIPKILQA